LLFSSPIFLFLFLPIVLAAYWFVGTRLRNPFLLGASLFFYAWGEGRYVLLLLVSIAVNYAFGVLAARYRGTSHGGLVLWITLVVNLGALIWYKYAAFIAGNLNLLLAKIDLHLLPVQNQHLPLGISFFTFQAIAYVLDVYREEAEPQRNLIRFSLFISLFPKLAAGPIIRYGEVADDLDCRRFDLGLLTSGVKRFVIGLGKKVLIADTLAKTADQIFVVPHPELTAGVAWLGVICYTLQIYFDFSGYSDMAIGLGRMLGFKIQENFNYPYIARSLTDFWRRWHISLSTWFRDYLFIPLSYLLMTESVRQKIAAGRYKTNYRTLCSIFIVFTLCGLWHGAGWNFIAWGMLHGAVLSLESLWLGKVMKKWWLPLQHAYLLFIVILSWVFFRSAGVKASFAYVKALSGFSGASGIQYHLPLYINNELLLVLLLGTGCAMPIASKFALMAEHRSFHRIAPYAEAVYIVVILAASFASLASSTFSPFIYQQF